MAQELARTARGGKGLLQCRAALDFEKQAALLLAHVVSNMAGAVGAIGDRLCLPLVSHDGSS